MLFSPYTLGNDYSTFPAQGALTLRWYTARGVEPLFYPHLSGGIPVGGLYIGQYFHFPAWLSSQLPGYWQGNALTWITLRLLLLLFALQALYYVACRRGPGLSRPVACALSFLAVYNLRTLDNLRYALAFEATVYSHAVVLLSALHVLAPSRVLLALIVVAAQLLLTCGYPALLPFAALGALLLLPVLFGRVVAHLWRRGAETLGAAAVGALLAAPHWLALAEWMAVNDRRVAKPDLEWANAWAMQPRGFLENLVYPWSAEVNSAFGGPTLLLMAGLALAFALARTRVGRAWLVVLAVPFVYALGTASPVFPFFFRHVPGFGIIRVPGRVFGILPILGFGALLLLRAHPPATVEDRLRRALRPAALLALVTCLVGLALVALRPGSALGGAASHEYSGASLSSFWSPAHRALWLALGALAAGACALQWRTGVAVALAGLATVGQTGMLMRHGTWTTERRRTASDADFAALDHLPFYGGDPLPHTNFLSEIGYGAATVVYTRFLRSAGGAVNCHLPVRPGERDRGVLLPFYLSPSPTCVATTTEALRRLETEPDCRTGASLSTLVTDAGCAHGPASPPVAGPALADLNRANRLVALTPNLAVLDVEADRAAVLVTPFPNATSNWSGWLDGRSAPLLEVDGGFLGLRVPPGRHQVEVRYSSRLVTAGYRAAFATALVLVFVGSGLVLRGRLASRGARVAAGLLAVAAFAVAVRGYARWEAGFVERATRRELLPNRYAERLAQQLARWREPPRAPGAKPP